MPADALPLLLPVTLFALLLGALCTWLYLNHRYAGRPDAAALERDFVPRNEHDRLQREADQRGDELREKRDAELALHRTQAELRSELRHLEARLAGQDAEMQRLQATSLAQFEQTAERLFREKSAHFTRENARQVGDLLTPLRERIRGFEQQIERRFVEETRDRVSLRQEIRSLQQLNVQISTEANNLAGALRGSSKTQGDWGEWQLLTLLEASGLQQGIHFRSQNSFRDEDGRQKRPDFIIDLPEGKQLVVDAKVSLTAYERHCACDAHDTHGRQRAAAAHLASLRKHVSDLASKNYTRLYQINTPDYLLLFVPIEPAYGLALATDRDLFLEALERNIVIVTPSTLLATLRTVSYIWKQDDQQRNVLEIARQGGALYDQFVSFTEELAGVGHRLDQARSSWDRAMRKLSTGGKRGATLVGRAERIRKLGVKTKKKMDRRLLEEE